MSGIETNWIIITGAQSSGKSDLGLHLAFYNGLFYIPEAARIVINNDASQGLGAETRRDEGKFQERVLAEKLALEERLDPTAQYVLDRGLHDTTAYDRTLGIPDSLTATQLSAHLYRRVFICESLGKIEQDGVRTEDMGFAIRLHEELFRAYQESGYSPIPIPKMPIDERAKFVLKYIE